MPEVVDEGGTVVEDVGGGVEVEVLRTVVVEVLLGDVVSVEDCGVEVGVSEVVVEDEEVVDS